MDLFAVTAYIMLHILTAKTFECKTGIKGISEIHLMVCTTLASYL